MPMERWGLAIAAGLAMVGAVGTSAAEAQVVSSPDAIRACLCKEQRVAGLNAEVQAQSRTYAQQRATFEALDKEVKTSRPRVDVKSQADVDAFKRLLERRDAAADALAGPATSNYAAAVQRYNQAVADYNGSCAGKAFDQDALAAEKRSLSCPKP
jgi:hypothetical protein